MIWKDYSHLEGTHAFLSPSRYHWINYSQDRLVESFKNYKRISLGIEYHALASKLINLKVRLPNNSIALNSFVNDAIGFRMESEVVLFFSKNCYGTADAISFRDGILRIHDLKTGKSPGSMDQLMIYAGLFCLNYELDVLKELRQTHLKIYYNEETIEFSPSSEDVLDVTLRIIDADRIVSAIEESVL